MSNEEIMFSFAEPAILVHRPFPPLAMEAGRSRVGGLPQLPGNFDWPRGDDGLPLHFLAQIDCGELPSNDQLPKRGSLFFFARIDDLLYFGSAGPGDASRVIYNGSPLSGPEREAPFDLPEIEGGHSSWVQDFGSVGDTGPQTYPSWVLTFRRILSFPDLSALPPTLIDDREDYVAALAAQRAAQVVGATRLPTGSRASFELCEEQQTPSGARVLELPADAPLPFPQVWVMAERACRRLASACRRELDAVSRRGGGSKYYKPEQLALMQQQAEHWLDTAAAAGLGELPSEDERQGFRSWLAGFGRDPSPHIRRLVQVAVTAGVRSAIQYAAGCTPVAALIPARYYSELEGAYLPATASKIGRGHREWQIETKHHQMLGHVQCLQEARPVDTSLVLLLNLVSDHATNFMFSDVNSLSFVIEQEDLGEGRYDQAFASID